jgi:hypothetical protein
VVIKVWKLDTSSSPRMIWLVTNSFLALASLGLTLADLRRFLLDRAYRESLLPQLPHEEARAFFAGEFPKTDGAALQWSSPVLNKLGSLVFDPDVRLMLAGNARISFREILDRQMILGVPRSTFTWMSSRTTRLTISKTSYLSRGSMLCR